MYVYRYRHNRIETNPESLEQFLMEQPHWRVIMNAFYFEMNSQYGHDFWKDISSKWVKYWKIYEDNMGNSRYVTLKGSFSILRQNWDKTEYWKIESVEDTYKRTGIEPPEGTIPSSEVCKFKIGDTVKSSISDEVVKILSIQPEGYEVDGGFIDFGKEEYWSVVSEPELEKEKEEVEEENNDSSLLEGFSLVETAHSHGGRKIGPNDVSVNLRNGGYRVTFSTKVSEMLRTHCYEYVKLLTNKDTMEIALIFNHQNGYNVTIKRCNTRDTRNVTINAKDIVEHIHSFFNLDKTLEYYCLKITATVQQDNTTIFKLKLK